MIYEALVFPDPVPLAKPITRSPTLSCSRSSYAAIVPRVIPHACLTHACLVRGQTFLTILYVSLFPSNCFNQTLLLLRSSWTKRLRIGSSKCDAQTRKIMEDLSGVGRKYSNLSYERYYRCCRRDLSRIKETRWTECNIIFISADNC